MCSTRAHTHAHTHTHTHRAQVRLSSLVSEEALDTQGAARRAVYNVIVALKSAATEGGEYTIILNRYYFKPYNEFIVQPRAVCALV